MGSGEGVSETGRRKESGKARRDKQRQAEREAMHASPYWAGPKCLGRSLNSKVYIAKLDLSNYS